MPTPPTEGFALSALPRSPNIPANVGVIDAKAVYDGVRQGLAAFENVRRAPQSMILADAQDAAATEQAPLKTRQLLAQTEGVEQQTPLRTAILASEASPEMLEAKRKALLARAVKPLTGTPYLLRRMDELRASLLANPGDPDIANAIIETTQLLNKASAVAPNDPTAALTSKENIAAGNNATKQTIATAANTTKEKVAGINAEGAPKSGTAAVVHLLLKNGIELDDPVIQGLLNKQSAEMAANPDADRAAKEAAAKAGIESREKIAAEANKTRMDVARATREQKLALLDTQHQQKLSHALGALETMDNNTKHVNDLIDEAINLTGPTSAGLAKNLAFLPFNARTLRGKLDAIRANIGFDALASMRQNSPTGGALGAVSDTENKLLQSTIESLDQGLSPDVLKQNLENVRKQREVSLGNLQRTYDRDAEIFKRVAAPGSTGAATQPAASITPEQKAAAQKWLNENPNDPRAADVRAKAGL